MDEIKIVDASKIKMPSFKKHLADCVILTYDNRILLQKRPDNWPYSFPGTVNPFGGHVEKGETPLQAVIRELAEETGAKASEQDLLFVGAVSESFTNHTELVHIYFWHDKENTITGCYEGEAISFDTVEDALAHPKIMPYARWALEECQRKGWLVAP
ncbi:MAG: NUDIX hydrolase [Alphaproteobacteria bacterium]|nr:NUDIX hydrolase [Alphaproteobacteria bacterium]